MFTQIFSYLVVNIFPDIAGQIPALDMLIMLFSLYLTFVIVAFPFMMVYWFIRRFL